MYASEYRQFLDSPEWWQERKRALARANYRCEREAPGGPRHEGPLEVHHRTYDRLGVERENDLEVLCHGCHAAERLARNRRLRELERYGQARLFDRFAEELDDQAEAAEADFPDVA